jgi:hypothetical protein
MGGKATVTLKRHVCHSFMSCNGAAPGQIVFLGDCTHALDANQYGVQLATERAGRASATTRRAPSN